MGIGERPSIQLYIEKYDYELFVRNDPGFFFYTFVDICLFFSAGGGMGMGDMGGGMSSVTKTVQALT